MSLFFCTLPLGMKVLSMTTGNFLPLDKVGDKPVEVLGLQRSSHDNVTLKIHRGDHREFCALAAMRFDWEGGEVRLPIGLRALTLKDRFKRIGRLMRRGDKIAVYDVMRDDVHMEPMAHSGASHKLEAQEFIVEGPDAAIVLLPEGAHRLAVALWPYRVSDGPVDIEEEDFDSAD